MRPVTTCVCTCRHFSASTASPAKYGATHISGTFRYKFAKLRRMPPALPRQFETKVTHSNGARITLHSTSPRLSYPLSRDVYNSALWDFAAISTAKDEDESGRMGRFAKRFGGGAATADVSTSSMAGLLDVGGELQAVRQDRIARADRSGKKKGRK